MTALVMPVVDSFSIHFNCVFKKKKEKQNKEFGYAIYLKAIFHFLNE